MSGKSGDSGAVLQQIGQAVQEGFSAKNRVLSYAEYLAVVRKDPRCHLRSAAQYIRDVFDFYGTDEVKGASGKVRRFRLFDAPWDEGSGRLIAQEAAQNHIYRVLKNFARQGRTDRLVLLHGPNGSSKSTITELIARAMEHYSLRDEGAIYRFNWIFPTEKIARGGIGFGGEPRGDTPRDSYAHLDEAAIDARMPCDLKDHPLLLLPKEHRLQLISSLEPEIKASVSNEPIANYLLEGNLSHKNKQIYEALLSAYSGDYLRVLRHVQVERFFVSRRYRVGVARVEPQMAVDARARQVTTDRSLSALPSSLQNIALYELDGPLIHANRGLIDYADFLKRPLEASKYLLGAVEDGRVSLDSANLFFDSVFIGSVNELHLNAFMESPEWMSFRGRIELIRVPYLLDYVSERIIYDDQVATKHFGKPVSPHATGVAALWAVLTRLRRPDVNRYEGNMRELAATITPREKADLYAKQVVPSRLSGDAAKTLRAGTSKIVDETTSSLVYEGRTGASPREVKSAVMNAAQQEYGCLSAEAVLRELTSLIEEVSVYDFLRQEVNAGYFDHKAFVDAARDWYLDSADEQVQAAMGFVEEQSYVDLFGRYIQHVTHAMRGERVYNPVTKETEVADEKFMADIEEMLELTEDEKEFRQGIVSKIGAWSVDHPGQKPDYVAIFPQSFQRLRERYFIQQHERVRRQLTKTVHYISDDKSGLTAEDINEIKKMLARMQQDYQYCDVCSREVLTTLLRERYSE